MDIVKTKKISRWTQPSNLMIGAAVAAVILLAAMTMDPSGESKADRSKLLIGSVQRGELKIVVDGYGVLRSQKQTLLTALTAATVQEVVLRPGAQVNEDSVILRLNNPELMQQVETANNALTQEKASFRRLVLNNQREMLTEQSTLADLDSTLQSVKLRREAEEGLAAKGVIPQITFRGTLLAQEQAKKRVDFQQERINQLKKVIKETEMIQKKQVEQAEANYQTIQHRADRLTVRAGIKGELQRLPVVLGQSVNAGQELALVGSDQDLLALIRVSQSKAEQLKVGQSAEINTRREAVAGRVTRITPEVRDGTIEVEVVFANGVPVSARSELNVDAKIFVATLKDTLFVERPINVQSNSKSEIFKLDAKLKSAEKQQVTFGGDSGHFIQVLGGAEEKDNFILSDMTNLRDVNRIRIVD